MLRLEGHHLGRVRDVEKHVEALVLLQDPPCGSPRDCPQHFPQEPVALPTPASGFPEKLTRGLWQCWGLPLILHTPSPPPQVWDALLAYSLGFS